MYSSTRVPSTSVPGLIYIYIYIYMLWLLETDGLMWPHSTSQPFFLENHCLANLSALALRVVTARVHVDTSGSFTFQINKTGPALTGSSE